MNDNTIETPNETPGLPETHTPPSAADLSEKLQSDRDARRVRNGKIAALPRDLRHQLNQRLQRGLPGPELLDWLNTQPQVLETLKNQFEAVSITKQNLSAWRQGGYVEWQVQQELADAAQTLHQGAQDVTQTVHACSVANDLATIIAAQYAALLNRWDGKPDPKFEAKLQILRRLTRDLSLLQKCVHLAAKQEVEFDKNRRLSTTETDHADWMDFLDRLDAALSVHQSKLSPPARPGRLDRQPQPKPSPFPAGQGQSHPVKVSAQSRSAPPQRPIPLPSNPHQDYWKSRPPEYPKAPTDKQPRPSTQTPSPDGES